tara:strand:+ start:2814 stop:4022 length:1209 start_codon:yes stop_codon:yes gene_type:complete
MHRKRSIYWALLIILIITAWIGSGIIGRSDILSVDTESIKEENSFDVRYILSEKNSYSDKFKIIAKTKADSIVELKVQTDGIVNDIFFDKGAYVEKDQIICKLDENDKVEIHRAKLAKYDQAKTNLLLAQNENLIAANAKFINAKTEYESQIELVSNDFASKNSLIAEKDNYESAKAELKSAENNILIEEANIEIAKAELKTAELNLMHTETFAPFAGVIDDVRLEIGELAQKSDICAVLIDNDPIIVSGNISEKNISKIQIGMEADVNLIDGTTKKGVITYISNLADDNTRSFNIEVSINNIDGNIRIGTTSEILINRFIPDSHKVPSSILSLSDEGLIGIKIINEDNIVDFIPVELMNLNNEGAFISNLPDKIKIITVGQDYVVPGQQVNGVLDKNRYNE